MGQIEILLPHGEVVTPAASLAPRPASLRGKRVGFVDNELWRSMGILIDEMSKRLSAEHGVSQLEVLRSGPNHGKDPGAYRAQLREFGQRVDAVVSGLGN